MDPIETSSNVGPLGMSPNPSLIIQMFGMLDWVFFVDYLILLYWGFQIFTYGTFSTSRIVDSTAEYHQVFPRMVVFLWPRFILLFLGFFQLSWVSGDLFIQLNLLNMIFLFIFSLVFHLYMFFLMDSHIYTQFLPNKPTYTRVSSYTFMYTCGIISKYSRIDLKNENFHFWLLLTFWPSLFMFSWCLRILETPWCLSLLVSFILFDKFLCQPTVAVFEDCCVWS